MRDYAFKEWSGLMQDLYYLRWQLYFDQLTKSLNNEPTQEIDFYTIDEAWTKQTKSYPTAPTTHLLSVLDRVRAVLQEE